MDDFKEFQAKDLDECIASACNYFNAPRENLEIEIIQDAKSGIFGIVLARKAKIRARRIRLQESVRTMLGEQSSVKKSIRSPKAQVSVKAPMRDKAREPAESRAVPKAERREKNLFPNGHKKSVNPVQQATPVEQALELEEFDAVAEGLSIRPMEELDRNELEERAREIVTELLRPLADREIKTELSIEHGNVYARVQWEGDAGLLIGREGQTLAALQYLASRMLSHAFNAALRVQLDIGDYRRKQDAKLRALAVSLAEKARQTGRPWSTRPLSSYHRRVIHMCLQDAQDVQTRSSGDGPMKRVVISPRRHSERS